MEILMATIEKKQKQIIVEQVIVTGYVKHANGRKSPFAFNKTDFDAKDLQSILDGVGRMYQ